MMSVESEPSGCASLPPMSRKNTFWPSSSFAICLLTSMLKWLLRRHQLYSDTKRDFDYALIGHWHQMLWGKDFFVNGSLKGYDEYAKGAGFGFEIPQQQLFLVTPERGIAQRLSVHAE